MEPQFWHTRWERQEIGFHLPTVNPQLQQYWSSVDPGPGTTVFVPLCGKSLDLNWLAERGHRVCGVELSGRALADFFAERQQTALCSDDGPFVRWSDPDGRFCLWEGDVLALDAGRLAGVAAIYDRAALVALPPGLRQRYAAHLNALLPDAPRLLMGFDYPQDEMAGPPFAVPDDEVRALHPGWRIDILEERNAIDDLPHLRARGMTRLTERVYRLLPPA